MQLEHPAIILKKKAMKAISTKNLKCIYKEYDKRFPSIPDAAKIVKLIVSIIFCHTSIFVIQLLLGSNHSCTIFFNLNLSRQLTPLPFLHLLLN